jgi:hypothetical protein
MTRVHQLRPLGDLPNFDNRISLQDAVNMYGPTDVAPVEDLTYGSAMIIEPRYLLYGLTGNREYLLDLRADLREPLNLNTSRANDGLFDGVAFPPHRYVGLSISPDRLAQKARQKTRKAHSSDPDRTAVERHAHESAIHALDDSQDIMEGQVKGIEKELDSIRAVYNDIPQSRKGLLRFSHRNFFFHILNTERAMDSSIETAGTVFVWSNSELELAKSALKSTLWARDDDGSVILNNWKAPLSVAGRHDVAQRKLFGQQIARTQSKKDRISEKLDRI